MSRSPIKVGVIGAGVGRLHLEGYRAITGDVEIVALCDQDEARLKQVGDTFEIPLRYTDVNELIASGKVEAVSICLPNNLHAPISIAALEAGLHVLCEKPLAETTVSGQKIIEAAARASGKFMICLNRRYRPDVQWMKKVLNEGRLGKIYQVRAGWLRETGIPSGWFTDKKVAGGGPLVDLGVHLLDAVLWLLDYPSPLTVSADVQANFGPQDAKVWSSDRDKLGSFNVEDTATAFIRLAGGIVLTLETNWASHARPGLDDIFITLMGTQGTVELYVANYAVENTLTFYTEMEGVPVVTRPSIKGDGPDHKYAVAEFIRCIKEDAEPSASAGQGLAIMKIIEAAYQSAAIRREVTLFDG